MIFEKLSVFLQLLSFLLPPCYFPCLSFLQFFLCFENEIFLRGSYRYNDTWIVHDVSLASVCMFVQQRWFWLRSRKHRIQFLHPSYTFFFKTLFRLKTQVRNPDNCIRVKYNEMYHYVSYTLFVFKFNLFLIIFVGCKTMLWLLQHML